MAEVVTVAVREDTGVNKVAVVDSVDHDRLLATHVVALVT
jgi:hypothetical protein